MGNFSTTKQGTHLSKANRQEKETQQTHRGTQANAGVPKRLEEHLHHGGQTLQTSSPPRRAGRAVSLQGSLWASERLGTEPVQTPHLALEQRPSSPWAAHESRPQLPADRFTSAQTLKTRRYANRTRIRLPVEDH